MALRDANYALKKQNMADVLQSHTYNEREKGGGGNKLKNNNNEHNYENDFDWSMFAEESDEARAGLKSDEAILNYLDEVQNMTSPLPPRDLS